jgi:pilus assembly protein CpaE
MPAIHVAMLSEQSQTVQAVAAALDVDGEHFDLKVFSRLGELLAHVEKEHPAAVLVELEPDAPRRLTALAESAELWARTRLVLLGGDMTSELLLSSMQVGARHFVKTRDIGASLATVLRRQVARSSAARGTVVTVLSAAGGCGATTVAVNLAHELSQLECGRVLLIDLDLHYGGAGAYLGLAGEYGLADALAQMTQVDPGLLTSSATSWNSMHVLLSPAGVQAAAPGPRLENMDNAIKAACEAYEHVVIDAPRVGTELAQTLALNSRLTLVLMQMTVKDIRAARQMRSMLTAGGVDPGRVVGVVSRYSRRRSPISLSECRRALGDARLELISNDYRGAVRGVNFGQPLSKAAPMSPVRKDLKRLAARLAGEAASSGGES